MSNLHIENHHPEHDVASVIIARLTSVYAAIAREEGIDLHMVVKINPPVARFIPEQRTW